MDSNHRRRKPADLQSAPFGHSGNPPYIQRHFLFYFSPSVFFLHFGSLLFCSTSSNFFVLVSSSDSELTMGIEPATTGLQNRCSTIELRQQNIWS